MYPCTKKQNLTKFASFYANATSKSVGQQPLNSLTGTRAKRMTAASKDNANKTNSNNTESGIKDFNVDSHSKTKKSEAGDSEMMSPVNSIGRSQKLNGRVKLSKKES